MSAEHPVIWLQPWCAECAAACQNDTGRMWCQDDVWGKYEACDRKSIKYVIAPTEPPLKRESCA